VGTMRSGFSCCRIAGPLLDRTVGQDLTVVAIPGALLG
jgi:hypothetical protein